MVGLRGRVGSVESECRKNMWLLWSKTAYRMVISGFAVRMNNKQTTREDRASTQLKIKETLSLAILFVL